LEPEPLKRSRAGDPAFSPEQIVGAGMRVRDITDYIKGVAPTPEPRRRSDSPRLNDAELKRRFRSQFQDEGYASLQTELDSIAHAAWDAYLYERKSTKTRKAGPGYADLAYDLAVDWIAAFRIAPSAMSGQST
jgi:hypothetical protein